MGTLVLMHVDSVTGTGPALPARHGLNARPVALPRASSDHPGCGTTVSQPRRLPAV
jgi:hypothetical protein